MTGALRMAPGIVMAQSSKREIGVSLHIRVHGTRTPDSRLLTPDSFPNKIINVTRNPYRLAAIDVGTNSIHMIVVEAEARGYRIIDKEKEMVQLGHGSLDGEPLTDDAMARGIAALRTMKEIATRWEVDKIVAVATSALREAPNRERFLREAEKIAGVKVRVISGEEEADFIFRAVRAAVDFHGGSALCIDIGGGSVELIVGTRDEVYFTASEPLGSLRLSQKFFSADPPGPDSLEKCVSHIRKKLKRPLSSARSLGFDFCVGTSGTILTLAEIASDKSGADEIAAGLRWLSRVNLGLLIPRLAELSADERCERFAIDPRRGESILAGALVIHEVLDRLDLDGLWACSAALREGIVERVLSKRRSGEDRETGVREASVLGLAERSNYERRHAMHVARLALRIFDQTTELHGLGAPGRELLRYAAILHEIGLQISFQRHHKHSYYLIRHAGLKGFTDDEVAVIANVARYYRKAAPKADDVNLLELQPEHREVAERLIAILRVADGLDRGHQQAVRDVRVRAVNGRVSFEVRPRTTADLEIESGQKRAKYFARLFERSAEVVVRTGRR